MTPLDHSMARRFTPEEIAAAKRAIAAAADTERLDWFSAKMQVCEVETWRRAGLNPNYATLRDAIDAARAEEEAR